MEISTIGLISQQVAHAIGTTLVYSLGQGVVLAAVTGIIVVCTRSQQPAVRYNWLTAAMFVFFVSNLVTFCYSIWWASDVKDVSAAVHMMSTLTYTKELDAGNASLIDRLLGYLQGHQQTLVMIWFLIVVARCLQLSVGLNRLTYLRKRANFEIDPEWKTRVTELANVLGIKQLLGLAESSLIKVPMVIGHFKPLILLPMGLLTAIPPQQIEAILIHELAHIQRRDYLVNILQRLMEILFFFNPAVLWLSNLIKAERENCCDDMAIGQTNSKFNYISALISCQEYQMAAPEFAMTFSKKEYLKDRVHRLVYSNNHSLSRFEKSILVLCIGLVGFGLLAFSKENKIESAMVDVSKAITIDARKKAPFKDSLRNTGVHSENVRSTGYKNVLDTDSVALKKALAIAEHAKLAKIDSIHQQMNRLQDSLGSLRVTLAPMQVKIDVSDDKIHRGNQKAHRTDSELGDAIMQELLKDGIISRISDKLSFKLSTNELEVDGKRVSNVIHQKYKDKFIPSINGKKGVWTMYHNYEVSTKVNTKTSPQVKALRVGRRPCQKRNEMRGVYGKGYFFMPYVEDGKLVDGQPSELLLDKIEMVLLMQERLHRCDYSLQSYDDEKQHETFGAGLSGLDFSRTELTDGERYALLPQNNKTNKQGYET